MNERSGQKQHYIPDFLLRKWIGPDHKIGVFRTDIPKLPYSRLSPSNTGYERGIYSLYGVPEADINLMEKEFMKPIDDNSSKAINKILRSGSSEEVSNEDVEHLLMLVASLELRSPARIESIKDSFYSLMMDGLEDGSQSEKQLLAFLENHPGESRNLGLNAVVRGILDRKRILKKELRYFVKDFTGQENHLLLSDYPCIRTTGVGDPNVILALPISPWKVLLGFKTTETLQMTLRVTPSATLLSAINESSFSQTRTRIYALDEMPRKFLEARMARRGDPI